MVKPQPVYGASWPLQKIKQTATRLQKNCVTLNEKMVHYRDSVAAKNPGSMLAALFKALKEPVCRLPPNNPVANMIHCMPIIISKAITGTAFSFTDERLLRTPIFEPRLDKYYKTLVVPEPDSIKKEVDIMLAKSAPNKEMYKYLLTYFVQQYINPQYMGQDAVFVHLFEKYINNNPEVDWFTEKYKKYMTDRAYSLMANLIGAPAQNLELVDTPRQSRGHCTMLKRPMLLFVSGMLPAAIAKK